MKLNEIKITQYSSTTILLIIILIVVWQLEPMGGNPMMFTFD